MLLVTFELPKDDVLWLSLAVFGGLFGSASRIEEFGLVKELYFPTFNI